MKKNKKEDKNKDLDKEKIDFLGDWKKLNPAPPVVEPEKFDFLGDWNKLNPDPQTVRDEKKDKKK